ncbi:hypothetical protein FHS29_006051 [Saccharothrix tamanrassetensis]|uniref:DUF5666 domain-containing protein n=1 Tax=Saccharothrix tamanrassetensis TaxID=1051531 RepID=A0A841CQD5_9PSEU|nr:hypothetical protein [Saccharothrix tamanrassetensis]MBB5959430.1 hypothetical protein [Saccharothrix tamanrassetensis]
MTTETENPTWGEAPPPEAAAPGPRWSGRKTLVAVAVAVGIAAVGGGVIYAASNSEAAQMGMGGPRGYGMGKPGMMITGPGPFGDTAHGEFQNGEITEVSDSSITIKSTDGFTRTYKITDDTRVNGGNGVGSLTEGDTVMLVADEENTAQTVVEGDFRNGRGNRQQPPGGDQGSGRSNDQGSGKSDDQGQPPTR